MVMLELGDGFATLVKSVDIQQTYGEQYDNC
jgi:hypothetical protein